MGLIHNNSRTCVGDHWALRADGSFYFFRNLEEESEYLLTDDRIARATERLIYCMRLYTSLGAERNARALISVTFGGLSGRSLGRQTPDRPETLERLTGACAHDSAQSEVVIELPNIMRSLHKLVDVLTTPLFANFDFYQLPAAERDRSINKSLLDWGLGNHVESAAQATEDR